MPRKNLHISLTWKLSKTVFILFATVFLFTCGPSKKKDPNRLYFENGADYNQFIISQFEEVNRLWNEALNKMDDSALVYKQLDSLRVQADSSSRNMMKLADWKGDTTYKYAAGRYFSYMYDISNGIFKEAIDIGLKQQQTDEDYFRFTEIGNQIGADKDTCIANLKRAQTYFGTLPQK